MAETRSTIVRKAAKGLSSKELYEDFKNLVGQEQYIREDNGTATIQRNLDRLPELNPDRLKLAGKVLALAVQLASAEQISKALSERGVIALPPMGGTGGIGGGNLPPKGGAGGIGGGNLPQAH